MCQLRLLFNIWKLFRRAKTVRRLRTARRLIRAVDLERGIDHESASANLCHCRNFCAHAIRCEKAIALLTGFVLVLAVFFYLTTYMELPSSSILFPTIVLGALLLVGMALSSHVRCFTLIIAPQLFSGKCQFILLNLVLSTIVGGVHKNLINNVSTLGVTVTCAIGVASSEVMSLTQTVKSQLVSVTKVLKATVASSREFADGLKNKFLNIEKLWNDVGDSIRKGLDWLKGVVNTCTKMLREPYRRCMEKLENKNQKCSDDGYADIVCGVIVIGVSECKAKQLSIFDEFCVYPKKVKDSIVDELEPKIRKIEAKVKEMFYVDVDITHKFNYSFKASKTAEEIIDGISQNIFGMIDKFVTVNNFIGVALMVYALINVACYIYRFESKDDFDNQIVSSSLRRLDARRQEYRESIFPLTSMEAAKYRDAASLKLSQYECKRLKSSLFKIFLSFIPSFLMMVGDVFLFYTNTLLQQLYGAKLYFPPRVRLKFVGSGLMPNMYRKILTGMDPLNDVKIEDFGSKCLRLPTQPDYDVYRTIFLLFGAAVFTSLIQAYSFRIRRMVCEWYYPKNCERRAEYLYNKIIRERGNTVEHH